MGGWGTRTVPVNHTAPRNLSSCKGLRPGSGQLKTPVVRQQCNVGARSGGGLSVPKEDQALSQRSITPILYGLILSGFALFLSSCAQPQASTPAPARPAPEEKPAAERGVPVIFDTDLGYDCDDDAGALAVLHALADRGEAEILATMTVVGDPQSAGALDVINTYYGRPDLPVGAYQGERWADAHPYWLSPDTGFLETLVAEYEGDIEDKSQAQGAVSLYRETLASQQDTSVTVVTVGFLENLATLLRSPADRHSPLSGRELVAQKVERLVVMGGRYPPDPELRDFNLSDGPYRDGRTAGWVIESWPTEIIFSGSEIGDGIRTGSRLAESLPENPVARAYELFPGTNKLGDRASWDLTAVLGRRTLGASQRQTPCRQRRRFARVASGCSVAAPFWSRRPHRSALKTCSTRCWHKLQPTDPWRGLVFRDRLSVLISFFR